MAAKECPMCGEIMRLREREVVDRLPGTDESKTTKSREWVCPECDYFEDVEELAG
jgi:transposase